jgi:hypothetical protein
MTTPVKEVVSNQIHFANRGHHLSDGTGVAVGTVVRRAARRRGHTAGAEGPKARSAVTTIAAGGSLTGADRVGRAAVTAGSADTAAGSGVAADAAITAVGKAGSTVGVRCAARTA